MKCNSASTGSKSAGMLHGGLATCGDKRPKPKSELMARLRKERSAKGLVELRLWLTPEQKDRTLKYVARIKRDV